MKFAKKKKINTELSDDLYLVFYKQLNQTGSILTLKEKSCTVDGKRTGGVKYVCQYIIMCADTKVLERIMCT